MPSHQHRLSDPISPHPRQHFVLLLRFRLATDRDVYLLVLTLSRSSPVVSPAGRPALLLSSDIAWLAPASPCSTSGSFKLQAARGDIWDLDHTILLSHILELANVNPGVRKPRSLFPYKRTPTFFLSLGHSLHGRTGSGIFRSCPVTVTVFPGGSISSIECSGPGGRSRLFETGIVLSTREHV